MSYGRVAKNVPTTVLKIARADFLDTAEEVVAHVAGEASSSSAT
ncbi:hypothetical protein ACFYRJ_42285 [Streptomyces sp. NPDC005531]